MAIISHLVLCPHWKKVHVIGGSHATLDDYNEIFSTPIEVLNLNASFPSWLWESLIHTNHLECSATAINGKIYVVNNGCDESAVALDEYDPESNTMTKLPLSKIVRAVILRSLVV